MSLMVRIQNVEVLNDYNVNLSFTNGTQRVVDLQPFLRGPIFESIRNDPSVFRGVAVDRRMGTIMWPNGADIDPDVLYHDLQPAWAESQPEVSTGVK